MTIENRRHRRSGFTVLEVLLVLGFLIVLTAVVIPRYTEAAPDDSREDILMNNLMAIRSQLKMYQVQHLNEYPSGKGTSLVIPENFVLRMTSRTNADHSPDGIFGPYFQDFPKNPFNGLNTVRYGSDPGAGMAGWCFDTVTGQMKADDQGRSPDGTAHHVY